MDFDKKVRQDPTAGPDDGASPGTSPSGTTGREPRPEGSQSTSTEPPTRPTRVTVDSDETNPQRWKGSPSGYTWVLVDLGRGSDDVSFTRDSCVRWVGRQRRRGPFRTLRVRDRGPGTSPVGRDPTKTKGLRKGPESPCPDRGRCDPDFCVRGGNTLHL